MAMKILKRYTKEEVISELLEKCPILRYRNEDDKFYEMIYYGDLPLFTNGWEKVIAPFIRLYYNTKMKSFCYKARIGMEEKKYVCNLWSTEHVIEQFKEDIEKIKDFKMNQKINKIKEDF